jgi:hypothetical protein
VLLTRPDTRSRPSSALIGAPSSVETRTQPRRRASVNASGPRKPSATSPATATPGLTGPLTPISRWLPGSDVRLAGPAPRSLARHDRTAQEELAAPDAPGLPPLQRSGEAGGPRRALPAQNLGPLHVIGRLSEEQFRGICAGQVRTEARDRQ